MADLSAAAPGERRRGQIILIAAFALAVTFVALAIIVNSAIFTENLASRGETAGTDDALYLRYELEGLLGEVVRQANVHNTSNLDQAIERGTENATHALERQHATRGAYVNVTLAGSRTDGFRIAQNESTARELESAAGTRDWTVVEDVPADGTRAFEFSLAKSSLATSQSDAFEVEVDDGAAGWEMELWHVGDDVVVNVTTGGGDDHSCTTTVPDATVTVHVTRGIVDDRPCTALRSAPDLSSGTSTEYGFGTGVGTPYDVAFRNGHNAEGNYSLVVSDSATPHSSNLNAGGSRTSPYVTDAVYSFVVDYRYERPRLTYRTAVRIAPGESP